MNKTYIATMGERFFMSKIAIATDSNSGITQAQGRELGIFVMPMPFYINDELFLEDITLSQEQFYQRLEEGADVKTTQPAPGDVLELWDRILKDYDELVYIPMSSGLSSSCETAVMLAQDYGGRVQVVNNQPHLRHPAAVCAGRPGPGRRGPERRGDQGAAGTDQV